MRHEMLTQRALFYHHANTKTGTLSQHFVPHVVPPLLFSAAPFIYTHSIAWSTGDNYNSTKNYQFPWSIVMSL